MSKMWKLCKSCSDVAHVVSLALIRNCCSRCAVWGWAPRMTSHSQREESMVSRSLMLHNTGKRWPAGSPQSCHRRVFTVSVLCLIVALLCCANVAVRDNWTPLTLLCFSFLLVIWECGQKRALQAIILLYYTLDQYMGRSLLSFYKMSVIQKGKINKNCLFFTVSESQ